MTNILANPLSVIFNQSFKTSCLPKTGKHSIISPIHKKGVNYRPVLLTCIPCRVMESIIKDVIMNYLSENNIISPSQHAFQKSIFYWLSAVRMYERLDCCCWIWPVYRLMLPWFCSAYDTVSIPKLLYKLNCYGFRGLLLSWLGAFLESITFCVRVNKENSNNNIQICRLHSLIQLAHCVSS